MDLPGHQKPETKEISTVFTSGGKMHGERNQTPIAPQNQTISAIVVLGRVAVGERHFRAHVRKREYIEQRSLSIEELLAEVETARGTDRDWRWRPLRVAVHENPYARIPFPQDLFGGPYDERYRPLDGRIQQLYQGAELTMAPREET